MAYRCSASIKEGEDLEVALLRVDKLVRDILEQVQATEYLVFLSGSNNFRKKLNPEYKANRKDQVPPLYLQDCREFLVTEWKAKLSYGQEADDDLGVNQTDDSIICSLDKDLRMIPGKHYSWEIGTLKWNKPAEFVEVDVASGNKHFWKQMLIGDKTDNIIGVNKIGPVNANKLIDPRENDQECFEIVLDKYQDDYERFCMNAFCLWIKRHKESSWHKDLDLILNDDLQLVADRMYASMMSLTEDI